MRKNLVGQTVRIKYGFEDPFNGFIPPGTGYAVEGYWDEVTGSSWKDSKNIPACSNYARRADGHLPLDDDVLYGKIGAFGSRKPRICVGVGGARMAPDNAVSSRASRSRSAAGSSVTSI